MKTWHDQVNQINWVMSRELRKSVNKSMNECELIKKRVPRQSCVVVYSLYLLLRKNSVTVSKLVELSQVIH